MAASSKPARIFLYIVAGLTSFIVILGVLYKAFETEIQYFALRQGVPDIAFEEAPVPPPPDYAERDSWVVLPDALGLAGDIPANAANDAPLDVDVFFLHPTTYVLKEYWNAPLDEESALANLDRVLQYQTSAFNNVGRLYAPRYRQAAFGAFLADPADMLKALTFAYGDVLRAFDDFIANRNEGRPFILAGHSQGALHALFLLRDRIQGTDLAARMVAAYVIGWPATIEADVAPLAGIEVCNAADQTGCLASWMSFAPNGAAKAHANFSLNSPSIFGTSREGATLVCTNPLSWTQSGAGTGADNLGVLKPGPTGEALTDLIPGRIGAACDENGIVILDPAPDKGFDILLPGKNYHVYDIHLFWGNVRGNARTRAEAYLAAN